ncbi:hypothetical protein GCM10010394_63120 [Streptomyces crystallinus]|uniref:Uncharacterized protein n=1 Tax=Streptomyces crystallinus TaxID=68191 RepID=A0ABN1GYN8_9ACTN
MRRILQRIDGDALDTAVGNWLAEHERAVGQEENDDDLPLPFLAAVSGAPTTPRSEAPGVRNHWGIENKIHRVRDTTYAEDASRVRTAPHSTASLRDLAIDHLASGTPLADFPQELHDLVADSGVAWDSVGEVKRVTLVGNRISAAQGSTKDDGTHVNTLWGELAWQLGGREAYDRMAEDDEGRYQPCPVGPPHAVTPR